MNLLKMRLSSIRWPSFLTGWSLVLFCFLPFLFILIYLFSINTRFAQINAFIDWYSVLTTVMLILSVSFFALLLGVIPAYLVVYFRFPLRGFFSRALILPLAIPGYVMAVIYSGIFDYGGEWQKLQAFIGGGMWADYNIIPFRGFWGLTWVLALSLFPYVFMAARNIFMQQSMRLRESALSLGVSTFKTWLKIILPLALPGILAGTGLVIMETLNDYGASAYYGVRTVTTEIFRYWNYDLGIALYFAGWLTLIPLIVLMFRSRFVSSAPVKKTDYTVPHAHHPGAIRKTLAVITCFIPVLFGLIIPVVMLVKWSLSAVSFPASFSSLMLNSFQLAALAALLTVVLSLLINHCFAMNRYQKIPSVTQAGYMMPGAILAIGVLFISTLSDEMLGLHQPNLLTGSIVVLIIAYSIRFLSVSLNPLHSVYRTRAKSLNETAQSLGAGSFRIIKNIEIPVYTPVMAATFMLVFIDVLKELPLTLLLRPFNFETLSTSVFQYAKVNESVQQAAPSALIIVILGMVPVLILHRYLLHGKSA
jgi:iron(III) transport system permease protein